ncbi:MAG: hypothetical protein BGO21_24275 [Dyadobacter sp. 50-39]|uniref:hypothetical protein n=1 Tax=Dyadobacter sp. 50-39 TaxID=1895756 RepID=UPI00095CA034|nr:hypothetical protein [Dyadobacter sp. 50-39]OJV18647.1 MAG: hypothetical protein BGO21_24275 [Dyadobacter sp. 50-39]
MKGILLTILFSILVLKLVEAQVVVKNRQQLSYDVQKGFFIENHLAAIILSEVPAEQEIDKLIKED